MSLVNKPLIRTLPPEILAEYDEGASITSLCKKYKWSRDTLKKKLIEAGREIRRHPGGRPKKKKPVVDHEAIAAKIEADREATEKQNEILEKPKRKIGW